ncbi:Caprin-2 [Mizuhopecten yessoensis]|uniref:Caprin-2 n=1 Tax=Mizuhopecten yessoensis TaxID=6573 RepID=A0A210Q8T6_MIZYE|nr:Caprin-2 [Mizuhopecten yessoensis]
MTYSTFHPPPNKHKARAKRDFCIGVGHAHITTHFGPWTADLTNIPNYFPPPSRRAGGSSNTVVAFSAGLTNTTQSHVATNVTYDRVFVNGGNGYNNQTGVFKAPLGGTYVFMFHALSQSNQPLRLDLYHNLDYIATGYAHAVHDYATSSNAVVLTIDRGNVVM